MTDAPVYRLYHELAGWWPLISPLQEYAADAAALERVFAAAQVPVRTVLDLGSGGGHVAWHLKDRRQLTLVDLSPQMLSVSRELNPECEHLQGDMLTLRLGRAFDAVLVHDAIDYVTTQDGLARVARTAFEHCVPGGIAVFAPDHAADTFRPGTGGGGREDGGRQASFRERTADPDPGDEWIEADYEFTLRSADGRVQVIREKHRLGAFRTATWLRALADAGFDPEPGNMAAAYTGPTGGAIRNLFIGHRLAGETVGGGG
ncbi:MAG TPA: class I SAM-dependent methyltransferase [Streptosporangiaceae bacterium]|nr:class I SAM-dependent methyltransferase [Streptosporangiaceae bacterium]